MAEQLGRPITPADFFQDEAASLGNEIVDTAPHITSQDFFPEEDVNTNKPSAVHRGLSNLGDYVSAAVYNDPASYQSLHKTQQQRPEELQEFERNIVKEAQGVADAEGAVDTLKAVGKTAGAAISQPAELASFIGEQAPNAIPSIAAGLAGRWAGGKLGALAGAPAGPWGAAIGFVLGMAGGSFATDYIAERAGGVMENIKDPNDIGEVVRAIADEKIISKAESDAVLHATGVAGVDLLSSMLTAGMLRGGGLLKGIGAFTQETIAEGAGEAAGQTLQGKELDAGEIALEMVGGAAQSAATTAALYPFGEAKTPALKTAQDIALQANRIDPNRGKDSLTPDYRNINNPIASTRENVDTVFESKDIAKAAYNINKYQSLVGNTSPGARIATDYAKKVIKDFILNPEADPVARQEAIDLIQVSNFQVDMDQMQKEYAAEVEKAKVEEEKPKKEGKSKKKAEPDKETRQRLAEKYIENSIVPFVQEAIGQGPKAGVNELISPANNLIKARKAAKKLTAAQRKAAIKRMGSADPEPEVVEPEVVEPEVVEPEVEALPERTPEAVRLDAIRQATKNVQGLPTEVAGEEVLPNITTPAEFVDETVLTEEQLKAADVKHIANAEVQYGELKPEDKAKIEALYGPDTEARDKAFGIESQAKENEVAETVATGVSEPAARAYQAGKNQALLAQKKVKEIKKLTKDLSLPMTVEGKTLNKNQLVSQLANFSQTTAPSALADAIKNNIKTRPKGGKPGLKTENIKAEEPFTPVKKGTGDPILASSGFYKGELTVLTQQIKFTEEGDVRFELGNGEWVTAEDINAVGTLKNNKVTFAQQAPKQKTGGISVTDTTHTEKALREQEQARQISDEEKAAPKKEKKAEAPKKITVDFNVTELDFILAKVKEARANTQEGTGDNIKAELDSIFGEHSFKEYQDLAQLHALDMLNPTKDDAHTVKDVSTKIKKMGFFIDQSEDSAFEWDKENNQQPAEGAGPQTSYTSVGGLDTKDLYPLALGYKRAIDAGQAISPAQQEKISDYFFDFLEKNTALTTALDRYGMDTIGYSMDSILHIMQGVGSGFNANDVAFFVRISIEQVPIFAFSDYIPGYVQQKDQAAQVLGNPLSFVPSPETLDQILTEANIPHSAIKLDEDTLNKSLAAWDSESGQPRQDKNSSVVDTGEIIEAPFPSKILEDTAKDDSKFLTALQSRPSEDIFVEGEVIPLLDTVDGIQAAYVADKDDYIPIAQIPEATRKSMLEKYTNLGTPKQEPQKTKPASAVVADSIPGDEDFTGLDQDEISPDDIDLDPTMGSENDLPPGWSGMASYAKVSLSPLVKKQLITKSKAFANKITSNVKDLDVLIINDAADIAKHPELTEMFFDADGNKTARASAAGGYFISKGSKGNTSDKNLVVMFADQFPSSEALIQDTYHEVVGHYGMRNLLGDQWDSFLQKALKTNPKATTAAYSLLNRWAHIYLSKDNEGNYTQAGLNRSVTASRAAKGYMAVKNNDGKTTYVDTAIMTKMMDEYIAEEAKRYADPKVQDQAKSIQGFMKRIFAYVRHVLRTFIGGENAAEVTDNDIAGLLAQSYLTNVEGYNVADLKKSALRITKGGTVPSSALIDDLEEAHSNYTDNLGNEYPGTEDRITNNQEILASALNSPEDIAKATNERLENVSTLNDMMSNRQSQNTYIDKWRVFTDELHAKYFKGSKLADTFDMFKGIAAGNRADTLIRDMLGQTERVTRQAEKLKKLVFTKKLTSEQDLAIRKAWLDGSITNGTFNPDYLTTPQANTLKELNSLLIDLQEKIVNSGILFHKKGDGIVADNLRKKILDSKGKWLHTEFIDYLNSDSGSGFLTSNINWMKKEKIPEHLRGQKGEVRQSKYGIIHSINMLARDTSLLMMYKNIRDESNKLGYGWVIERKTGYPVHIEGKVSKKTITQMYNIRDQKQNLLDMPSVLLHQTADDIAAIHGDIKNLNEAIMEYEGKDLQEIKDAMVKNGYPYSKLDASGAVIPGSEIEITDEQAQQYRNENYVMLKGDQFANMGVLTNMMIDKRWYDVIVSESTPIQQLGTSWVDKMLGLHRGSYLDQGNSWWKALKTVYNPTYWPRAFFGTAVQADMASDSNSATLTKYYYTEMQDAFFKQGDDLTKVQRYAGKTLMDWAIEKGAYSTNFSTQELYAIRDDLHRDKASGQLKKTIAEKKYGNIPMFMMSIASDSMYVLGEKLSKMNANMEGTFKQMLMRDYIEIHMKQKGFKSMAQLNAAYDFEHMNALMQKAAEYAGKGVFEYHDIPNWLKTLRRIPLGTPFLTWSYKMFGSLGRATVKRPWKVAKYYALGWAVTEALLAGSDMDEDEYEQALKALPWHMKNKSSVMVLPGKNADGQIHYIDWSWMFPPAFVLDAFMRINNPAVGQSRLEATGETFFGTTGLFNGPIPQTLAAILASKDPFTGRDIWVQGAPTEDNVGRYAKFFWNMAVPPALSSTGIAGDIWNANKLDEYGQDKNPFWSTDVPTILGASVKTYDPNKQRVRNMKRYQYLSKAIKSERTKTMKDTNMSIEAKLKNYTNAAQRLKQLHQDFLKEN